MQSLLSRFQRVTANNRRVIGEIDGMRFVAIALVVAFHLNGYVSQRSLAPVHGVESTWLFRLLSQGHYGVEIFFAISGFILCLPFAESCLANRELPSLKTYYLRRLTRLEPPYLLTLVAFTLLYKLVNHEPMQELLPHFLASAVYQHSLAYGTLNPVNCVTWSLEIEIQFYLLAPVLTWLIYRLEAAAVRRAVLTITTFVWSGAASQLPEASKLHATLLGYGQYFLIGFLVADVFLVTWKRAPAASASWDLVSVACWLLLPAAWITQSYVWVTFPTLLTAAFLAALRGKVTHRVFASPGLTAIGGMCYTIYLIHYPLISAIGRVTRHVTFGTSYLTVIAIQFLLVLPVIVFVSAIFFLAVEKPCMRPDWPKRLRAWLGGKPGLSPAIPPG